MIAIVEGGGSGHLRAIARLGDGGHRGLSGDVRARYLAGVALLRGLGLDYTDPAAWALLAQQLPAGSFTQVAAANCAANPTPACVSASQSWFTGAYIPPAGQAAINAALAAGAPIPAVATVIGVPGVTGPSPSSTPPVSSSTAPAMVTSPASAPPITVSSPPMSAPAVSPDAASLAASAAASSGLPVSAGLSDFFSSIPTWGLVAGGLVVGWLVFR